MPLPRAEVERRLLALLAELAADPPPNGGRYAVAKDGLVAMLHVGAARLPVPTAVARTRQAGAWAACREACVEVVRVAGVPVGRATVQARLKRGFGAGTVAKVLGELTAEGVLTNPRDKRGYRLPEWVGGPGSLFPAEG